MPFRSIVPVVAVVLAAVAAAGCGSSSAPPAGTGSAPAAATGVDPNAPEVSPAGDIPDNQAFVAFAPRGAGFSVKVPEGWSRTTAGDATTFTDKLNAIRIESHPAQGALTAATATAGAVPQLATSVEGFASPKVSTVTRSSGRAVLITYLAAARPNAVTGKAGTDAVERYSFFRGGTELVLTLSGPKGADNVDPWRIVTDSVRWGG
ncbi:MAG: hypothetical protein JWO90_1076 [Solirubrobacterales bacterium]|nr:hypothetical protein [Solirubrobacterales bacterium]